MAKKRLEAGIITVAMIFLFAAGCSQHGHLEVNTRGNGLLTGTVVFTGVPCPPDRMKVPPCDGPYPDYEVKVYKEDGKTIAARVRTDKEGDFRLELPEGSYVVYSKRAAGPMASDIPDKIDIEQGKTARVVIHIDTGIR